MRPDARSQKTVPMIRIENLHKQFGDLQVLRGVDIEVPRQ